MSETPERRLDRLGIELPRIARPAGNLLGFKIDRERVFVSGQLPLEDGRPRYLGRIGASLSREEGAQAARLAALNAVAQLSLAAGGQLSKIGIVKVSGFVNCAPDFIDIPFVVDGAPDLFVAIFGEAGTHARFAVGVASLPRGVPVEIDVIARISAEG